MKNLFNLRISFHFQNFTILPTNGSDEKNNISKEVENFEELSNLLIKDLENISKDLFCFSELLNNLYRKTLLNNMRIINNFLFKNKIKGKIGTFSFKDRKVTQDLDIYKVENKKFIKF